MKMIGLDIFSLDADNMDFNIIIGKEDYLGYKILNGSIIFKLYHFDDNENMHEIKLGSIRFYIFNTFSKYEFLDCADSISGDLLYVASAFSLYASNEDYWGSKMIIDDMSFDIEELNFKEKLYIIELFLKIVNDIFEIIGITFVLFMTKALMLKINIDECRVLLNSLIRKGFIPIYQDEIDIVVGKNITYI